MGVVSSVMGEKTNKYNKYREMRDKWLAGTGYAYLRCVGRPSDVALAVADMDGL
jgi:hypothetical protein